MALQNRESDQLEAGKKVADFEGGGFQGVGAVRAIVANAGAEVVADSARSGFLGVGSAHGVAPFQDRAFRFENHSEYFAGAHKVREFTKEGPLAMDGIEAASFFFGEAHGFDGDNFETRFVNTGKDFSLLTATDRVGLDDCESALKCQERILQIRA
jgi:hypothetical protein